MGNNTKRNKEGICKECGNQFLGYKSNRKYCYDCDDKRRTQATQARNKKKYYKKKNAMKIKNKNDNELTFDVVDRNLVIKWKGKPPKYSGTLTNIRAIKEKKED
jgi:hypothetical protein